MSESQGSAPGQDAKVTMRVEEADGRHVLHLTIDREVIDHLAERDRVTVLGSDLELDPAVVHGGVRYVTVDARPHGARAATP
ncbi:hypothetical protein ACIQWN_38540 [Streptomyces vinaceus]|uniref:hypothetical protein n=1 Tax=Streptomyces vinaceus TaxID=1960 RepID=UPI00380B996F